VNYSFKTKLKGAIFNCIAQVARLSRGSSQRRARSAVIIPPASPGGLGDDALVTSLLEQLLEKGIARIAIGTWDASDSWPSAVPIFYFPLPGKTLSSWIRAIWRIVHSDEVYVLGADMLDGYYGANHSLLLLRIPDIAARAGVRATIIGSSFSDSPAPEVSAFLKTISPRVSLNARDHLSRGRLEEIVRRPIPLTADIAFLLKPRTESDSVFVSQAHLWAKSQRASKEALILGCNINSLPLQKCKLSVKELVDAHLDAILRLRKQFEGLSIILLPHDRRAPHDDAECLAAFERELPSEISRYTDLLTSKPRAAELKGIARECDFVLTGRMHLAIGALGCGVPTMCVGYQGKYEGLYNHFKLADMVLPVGEVCAPNRLADQLLFNIQRRANIAEQISALLPSVRQLAKANIQFSA
jgi:polysaccharide pyruvyl transferase WcaK-like protein